MHPGPTILEPYEGRAHAPITDYPIGSCPLVNIDFSILLVRQRCSHWSITCSFIYGTMEGTSLEIPQFPHTPAPQTKGQAGRGGGGLGWAVVFRKFFCSQSGDHALKDVEKVAIIPWKI